MLNFLEFGLVEAIATVMLSAAVMVSVVVLSPLALLLNLLICRTRLVLNFICLIFSLVHYSAC